MFYFIKKFIAVLELSPSFNTHTVFHKLFLCLTAAWNVILYLAPVFEPLKYFGTIPFFLPGHLPLV